MMIYDHEKADEFRSIAITDASELEVGKAYYSNFWPTKPLFVYELITRAEHNFRIFGDPIAENSSDDLRWIRIGKDIFDIDSYTSLRDNNVGASYNPWFLFANETDKNRCVEELKIEFREFSDDPYDFRDEEF